MAQYVVAIFGGHNEDTWERTGGKGVRTSLEPDGVYEEHDSNMDIASEIVKLLNKHDNVTVLFPQKNGHNNMTLYERVQFCNDHQVDFTIFVHSNASANRSATGACAFYYPSSPAEEYANYYAEEMKNAGYPLWQGGTYECQPGTWSNFYVVRNTNMPVCLTENFFFTNPVELRKYLLDPVQLDNIAKIHYIAASRYLRLSELESFEPPNTQVKPEEIVWYLARGDNGIRVGNLQRKLKMLGYYDGAIDNNYGPLTEKAVKEFQRDQGLVVDGYYGPKTQAALNNIDTSSAASRYNLDSIVPYPGPVQYGDTGKNVKRVQRAVGVEVDGIFGPKTLGAVKDYQREKGIAIDGSVGPVTWGVMF